MKGFISLKKLRKLGILGMNSRNINYISRYNSRKLYCLVDDKLRTKELAEQYSIPSPKLYFVVKEQHEIRDLERLLKNIGSFALKPAKGSGGKGILIIRDSDQKDFIKSSGAELTINDIRHHVSNIIAGLFSLAGNPDVAIVEELIQPDDIFNDYSFEGVPDIRIIVFKGYPVMAMLRLATRASDGKANLHQGALGVGLDLKDGHSIKAVQYSLPVTNHPDTGRSLDSIKIPDWKEIMKLACGCYEMTGLGYIGVDIVLDKNKGPLLLEMNARPGLAIQIANGIGLLPRLKLVERRAGTNEKPEERVCFSMNEFESM